MLSIRNLTKSYKTKIGRHYVFKDVSFDFPESVNIGILGPNGAGKSTLLRILGGIDHPDSGEIYCDRSMSWPLGLKGGFLSNITGRENCRIVCGLYGLTPEQKEEKLDFIKNLSGIGHYFEEPVKYYSSGMTSRVGFALSMAFDFEIILIDEITAVGDQHFRDSAKKAVQEKRHKANVIMVSHSMGNIREFCDVGILIKDGTITAYDNLDDAIRAYLPQEKAEKTSILIDQNLPKLSDKLSSPKEDEATRILREQITGTFKQIEQALADGDTPRDVGKLHYNLGVCYYRMGDMARAYQSFQLAVAATPDEVAFHHQLVNVTMQLGLLEQAEDAIEDALKFWPENAELCKQLGVLRSRQGRFQEAVEAYRQAIDFAPKNAGFYNMAAMAMLSAGHLDDALRYILTGLELAPDNAGFYRTLSKILASQGLMNEAISALHQADIKTPKQQQAEAQKRTLNTLKSTRGQLEKSAEFLP